MEDIPSLAFTCSYHFGDNYGIFPDACYVGHMLTLPLTCTRLDDSSEKVTLIFETQDIETWGTWRGHKVSIGATDPCMSVSYEIGRLYDPSGVAGRHERFMIEIPTIIFKQYVKATNNFYLCIELERQPHATGMSDDFVWTRLETTNCNLRIGWK